jgi:TolB-like protein
MFRGQRGLIAVLVLSTACSPAVCGAARAEEAPPSVVTVAVSGAAVPRDGDAAAARKAALEDAFRNAIEQACGVHVTSASRVQNFELVSDAILWQAEGYVQSYTVTDESAADGVYRLTIQAQVDVGAVRDYAERSVLVADFSGRDQAAGSAIAEAFTAAFAGSPRYHVLERTTVRVATAAVLGAGAGILSDEERRRVAKQLGTRFLVTGSYVEREGRVTLSARFVDLASGRVARDGSTSLIGPQGNLLSLSGQLANRLHMSLTGLRLQAAPEADPTPEERLQLLESLDPAALLGGSGAPVGLTVSLDRGADPTYHTGDTLALRVKSDRDCYLTLYAVDVRGRVTLLFPNGFQSDNRLRAGRRYTIPDPTAVWALGVAGDPGVESIQAIASAEPLELCAPGTFAGNPFPWLSDNPTEFVAKSVAPRLIAQQQAGDPQWTSAVVRFYHAPAAEPMERR